MVSGKKAPLTSIIIGINLGIHVFLMGLMLSVDNELGPVNFVYYKLGLISTDFWGLWSGLWDSFINGISLDRSTLYSLVQPFSSLFIHGGLEAWADMKFLFQDNNFLSGIFTGLVTLLHVGFNMMALKSLGTVLEKMVGLRKYALVYLLSGLGGGVLHLLIRPGETNPAIGASGAVLGLLGAMAWLIPQVRLMLFVFPIRIRSVVIGFVGISTFLMLYGMVGGTLPGWLAMISHEGHLGGIIVGYLFARATLEPLEIPDTNKGRPPIITPGLVLEAEAFEKKRKLDASNTAAERSTTKPRVWDRPEIPSASPVPPASAIPAQASTESFQKPAGMSSRATLKPDMLEETAPPTAPVPKAEPPKREVLSPSLVTEAPQPPATETPESPTTEAPGGRKRLRFDADSGKVTDK